MAARQRKPSRAAALAHAKRIAKMVAGFLLLGIGIVLLPLPGPGWLVIALALGVLSTEFEWARRLLDRLKQSAGRLRDVAFGSKRHDGSPPG
jgi:uncharacterized protein (TIGR02611 family)